MAAPIGVTFIPTQENADQGTRQGALTGDVQDAYRILSLQLPRVSGAHAITPQSNLTGAGSAGLPSVSAGGQTGPIGADAAMLRMLSKRMIEGNGASADPMGGNPQALSAITNGSTSGGFSQPETVFRVDTTRQRKPDIPDVPVFNDGTQDRVAYQAPSDPKPISTIGSPDKKDLFGGKRFGGY